jgi:hypothetical protein
MKSWFFIDKAVDKFYICPLIEKMGIVSIFLNIKSILKRSRGGDSGSILKIELIQISGANIN